MKHSDSYQWETIFKIEKSEDLPPKIPVISHFGNVFRFENNTHHTFRISSLVPEYIEFLAGKELIRFDLVDFIAEGNQGSVFEYAILDTEIKFVVKKIPFEKKGFSRAKKDAFFEINSVAFLQENHVPHIARLVANCFYKEDKNTLEIVSNASEATGLFVIFEHGGKSVNNFFNSLWIKEFERILKEVFEEYDKSIIENYNQKREKLSPTLEYTIQYLNKILIDAQKEKKSKTQFEHEQIQLFALDQVSDDLHKIFEGLGDIDQQLQIIIQKELFDSDLLKDTFLSIVDQISESVYNMHKLGFIHNDLKPDNILVKKVEGEYVVSIVDMGVSSFDMSKNENEENDEYIQRLNKRLGISSSNELLTRGSQENLPGWLFRYLEEKRNFEKNPDFQDKLCAQLHCDMSDLEVDKYQSMLPAKANDVYALVQFLRKFLHEKFFLDISHDVFKFVQKINEKTGRPEKRMKTYLDRCDAMHESFQGILPKEILAALDTTQSYSMQIEHAAHVKDFIQGRQNLKMVASENLFKTRQEFFQEKPSVLELYSAMQVLFLNLDEIGEKILEKQYNTQVKNPLFTQQPALV